MYLYHVELYKLSSLTHEQQILVQLPHVYGQKQLCILEVECTVDTNES